MVFDCVPSLQFLRICRQFYSIYHSAQIYAILIDYFQIFNVVLKVEYNIAIILIPYSL